MGDEKKELLGALARCAVEMEIMLSVAADGASHLIISSETKAANEHAWKVLERHGIMDAPAADPLLDEIRMREYRIDFTRRESR